MASEENNRFIYELEQWPPPAACLVLSLQWLMLMVPGLLVLGALVAGAMGLDEAGRVSLLQRLFLITGLAQAAQTLAGHRLPALVGPSTVLLVGVLSTISAGPGEVFCGMALGGAATALLGLAGVAARLKRLFTRPVLAATLVLIALVVAPTVRDHLFDPSTVGKSFGLSLLFSMGLVMAMLTAQQKLSGLAASGVLLMGMAAGSLLYHLAGMGPPPLAQGLHLGNFGPPGALGFSLAFNPAVFASFLLCYLALVANELATVEATAQTLGIDADGGRVNRAVAVAGLSGAAAGLLGVLGPVSYGMSPGVAVATRSASRFTLLPAAAACLLLAFWPGGVALFYLVPAPVVGAVLFTVMASQVFAGLNLMMNDQQCRVDWSQGVVVGSAMLAGICVSFIPPAAAAALHPYLRPLLANGFVVGLALALALEHLVLKRRP